MISVHLFSCMLFALPFFEIPLFSIAFPRLSTNTCRDNEKAKHVSHPEARSRNLSQKCHEKRREVQGLTERSRNASRCGVLVEVGISSPLFT
ncbi:hypothetical protein BJ742DRAFT_492310 [Cladochytrium replicatum]|nr:hypothetical protein BJ742DRAFT_492310 [Cladochytrium replicatum]